MRLTIDDNNEDACVISKSWLSLDHKSAHVLTSPETNFTGWYKIMCLTVYAELRLVRVITYTAYLRLGMGTVQHQYLKSMLPFQQIGTI
ncbi:hypothetical protein FGIG_11828 [Fasciola gigantica]|uniref:Uncharacterized protein n=1 Tax=Fasciola gigantica TaxID=46835 RepID=A0A504YNP6_FASGI|nr:hypothetical protein FGIG_11828 [Fasciola gigantica]